MSTDRAPWVQLEGTVNTRDLGGLPANTGKVRRCVLLRSDNLQDLTQADVDTLTRTVGVRTVLDLRTEAERLGEGAPPLQGRDEVTHLHLPFIPDTPSTAADPGVVLPDRWADGPRGAYLHYLRDRPDSFAAAVRRLADPDAGATVVHCAAGKDRTGVLVAVVLDAVGVPRDRIMADYALSNERMAAIFDRLAGTDTYGADVRRIGLDAHTVDGQTMGAVLGWLDEQYGSPADFLRAAGVSAGELSAMHDRLVEAA